MFQFSMGVIIGLLTFTRLTRSSFASIVLIRRKWENITFLITDGLRWIYLFQWRPPNKFICGSFTVFSSWPKVVSTKTFLTEYLRLFVFKISGNPCLGREQYFHTRYFPPSFLCIGNSHETYIFDVTKLKIFY